jgi:hypothetical protein
LTRSRFDGRCKASIAGGSATGDGEGAIGIGHDPKGTGLHRERRSSQVTPGRVATESLEYAAHVAWPLTLCAHRVQPHANECEGNARPADRQDVRSRGQVSRQDLRACLRRGDDLLDVGRDAQLLEVRGDLLRRAACIVGDEGEGHPRAPCRRKGIGGAWHGVISDVDHSVEVKQGDIVHRGERR